MQKISDELDLSILEITNSEFEEEIDSCIKYGYSYEEIKESFEEQIESWNEEELPDRYMV